ncbi:peptidoglycan editing factor PgeF [Pasteurella canis]|uniref:Purine nucleoside phosphorylase n=1 Tax=Pasteurella canis TaxID=753 RepID=A0ABQ4VI98_9PAST|nr:peptidoglycan editing factor PgeF [Pasteurella canis]MXN89134.1 peptidoglycan editing factor PgeF [Pasteurella canis]UEC22690.1 peptidoglycan editing factor PgeF [Pasteurella canis]GJH43756.1 laccase domain protein [Pasteurella canis]
MSLIKPNWNGPDTVSAFSTLRQGGVSLPPYDSFNLGSHVGDDQNSVRTNRTLLVERLQLPQMPVFLEQIHSTKVIKLPITNTSSLTADAVYTDQPNQVCLVMTADCLPVLLTAEQGNEVAAVHAGWRGLCNGILEQTVAQFRCPKTKIIAWLGPAIGPKKFQVGQEVVEQFCKQNMQAGLAFKRDPNESGKYLGNLYLLATQRLNQLGITNISGGEYCTFTQHDQFFSYRRERQTGRMATLIWFADK